MDEIQLQNWLQFKATNSLNKINIITYFENLTIELHVLYALNTHVKFVLIGYYLLYDLQAYILCIILNYKNLQFKKFIDDIVIDL